MRRFVNVPSPRRQLAAAPSCARDRRSIGGAQSGDPADGITQGLDRGSPRDIELTCRKLACCVTHVASVASPERRAGQAARHIGPKVTTRSPTQRVTLWRMSSPHEAPSRTRPTLTLRRILLATDLSPATDLATEWAFELASRNDAALLVVSVIDPDDLVLPGGGFRVRVDQVRDRREAVAQRLVERGRDIGVKVDFLVWTGAPGESIVAAAEAERVDMILVGAHKRGLLSRLVIGSVSEYVARHATCPVLIVRDLPETNGSVTVGAA